MNGTVEDETCTPKGFSVLHPQEARLVRRLEALLESRSEAGREGLGVIGGWIDRLERLWSAIDMFPSVYSDQSLGRRRRNFDTLVEAISCVNPYVAEAYLPTRSVLGRGYAMAKFNFCRALGLVVDEFLSDTAEAEQLRTQVEDAMRASICTLIAEDLLMSVTSDEQLDSPLRRRAAVVLAGLWEERAVEPIREFAGLLTSIWNAKARITINYGTLAGVTELFGLATAGCDPEFLSYFCREDVPDEENAALLEFMFNATFEELEVMRRYMRDHNVKVLNAEDVARIFNVPPSRLHRNVHTAEDIFFTFRERQVMASQRKVRNLPGPKKTAEEYVMICFLRRTVEGPEPGDVQNARRPAEPVAWPQETGGA